MNKRNRNVPPPAAAISPTANAVSQAFPPQHQIHVAQQVTTIFDPDVLKKYSLMVPDAPERVLAVFEKNAESERNIRDAMAEQQRNASVIQANAIQLQANDNKRRDWMTYSLMVIGVVATIGFVLMDKNVAAISAFVAVIGYAATGYFSRTKQQSTK